MFGANLLPLLVLALGAALAGGNVVALIRPPAQRADTDLERPPLTRSVVMIVIGVVAAVWALATLTA